MIDRNLIDSLSELLEESGMQVTFTGWKAELEACEKERDKLRKRIEALERVVKAADLYMNQPKMSCYASKRDWRTDSDLRGQALLEALEVFNALDALDGQKEGK